MAFLRLFRAGGPDGQVQSLTSEESGQATLTAPGAVAWHGPGSAPFVRGYTLGGGLVYVGRGVASEDGCAIDPSLPVGDIGAPEHDDPARRPSYAGMSPAARLNYLRWLAAGKCDPYTDPANVALYVAGLERRIILERADPGELRFLAAELGRLRHTYHGKASLERSCAALEQAIELIGLIRGDRELGPWEPDLTLPQGTMPLRLKAALAVAAAESHQMAFGLAAAGLLAFPGEGEPELAFVERHPRPLVLERLGALFRETFPHGFRLNRRDAPRLALPYGNGPEGTAIDLAEFADECSLPEPCACDWEPMIRIACKVRDELEGVPLMGSEAAPKPAVRAKALPERTGTTSAADPQRWLDSLPRPVAAVSPADLLRRVLGLAARTWDAEAHQAVTAVLVNAGRGIEPDPADGDTTLDSETEILVLSGPGCLAPRCESFHAAIRAAALFAEVAAAGGRREKEIEAAWLVSATKAFGLPPAEALRLAARMNRFRGREVRDVEATRLAGEVEIGRRELVGRLAAEAATAGGPADARQLVLLERLYDLLGVSKRGLYSIVQRGSAAAAVPATEPVTVAPGEPVATYSIPLPARAVPKPKRIRKSKLDPEKARKVRKDTEKVALILEDVFGAEDAASPPAAPEIRSAFQGLDPAHAGLLAKLLERGSWDRRGFGEAAKAAGLMPDGALEALNEWAYEKFDAAIVEDGDPIVVQPTIAERMGEVTDAS